MATSPLEWDPIVLPLMVGPRILDLGCGFGHWGDLVDTHWAVHHMEDRPSITGVDVHEGNLVFTQRRKVYDALVCAEVLEFLMTQADKSFDTILAMEILEHNPREWGTTLLKEMERVASKRLIISTPNYSDLRPGDIGPTGIPNPHNAHVSVWHSSELRALGYRIMGVRMNWKNERGGAFINRLLAKLRWFGERNPTLKDVANMWVHRHPATAMYILCWKDLGDCGRFPLHWTW